MPALRLEAERMFLDGYMIGRSAAASAGEVIVPSQPMGTAMARFSGADRHYQIVVGHQDGRDGPSHLSVRLDGVLLDNWMLDGLPADAPAQTGDFTLRTVGEAVFLRHGQTIAIEHAGAPARIDHIDFLPVDEAPAALVGGAGGDLLVGDAIIVDEAGNEILIAQHDRIFGLGGPDAMFGGEGDDLLVPGKGRDLVDGGPGLDTVSYLDSNAPIVADLGAGKVTPIARIMPLGASITYGMTEAYGEHGTGGYRTALWTKAQAEGLFFDFVGSVSTGPAELGDRDHNGYSGRTINWIDAHVGTFLERTPADVILMIVGTNDTAHDTAPTMVREMKQLIGNISALSPDTHILLGSLPPIDPAVWGAGRVQTAVDFNNALPDVVAEAKMQGVKVDFVDMRGRVTQAEMSLSPPDNGLHPNNAGYTEIAEAWYEALAALGFDHGTVAVNQDTLVSVENIIGSPYADTIIGSPEANVIEGGFGADVLVGGGGPDQFVYRSPAEGGDLIVDFDADDLLVFSALQFGGGLQAGLPLLETGMFIPGTDPQPVLDIANFLYDAGTGLLRFDADGAGLGQTVDIVTLAGAPELDPTQFVFIA